MTTEAHEVAVKLLSKHFGKPLPRPYVCAARGLCRCPREGPTSSPASILSGCASSRMTSGPYRASLSRSLSEWKRGVTDDQQSTQSGKRVRETVEFYEQELAQFRRWRRQALERA